MFLSRFFLLTLLTIALLIAQKPTGDTKHTGPGDPCKDAMTQQELNACWDKEYRRADAHLDRVYRNLLASMRSEGGVQNLSKAQEKSYAEVSIEKLEAAERAWVQYRDLHCEAAVHEVLGGSMSPMVRAGCLTEVTEHRIEELKHAYEIGDRKLE